MKKGLSLLRAVLLICSLSACSVKDAVQEKTREALDGLAGNAAPASGDSVAGAISSPAESYDTEHLLYVGGADEWTPFPGKSGVSFATSDSGVLPFICSAFDSRQRAGAAVNATGGRDTQTHRL